MHRSHVQMLGNFVMSNGWNMYYFNSLSLSVYPYLHTLFTGTFFSAPSKPDNEWDILLYVHNMLGGGGCGIGFNILLSNISAMQASLIFKKVITLARSNVTVEHFHQYSDHVPPQ